jgi:WD40 repeat protein
MLRHFAIATLVVASTTAEAGSLRKMWDFDAGAPGVYALSFSPDGQRIAVVVGRSWRDESLVVLNVTDPKADPKHIEIPNMTVPRLSWSPSGQQLAAAEKVIRLGDGKSCSLPEDAGWPLFLGDDRLVAASVKPIGPLVPGSRIPRVGHPVIAFFSADCQSTDSWGLSPDSSVMDISTERGLICIRQYGYVLILDLSTRSARRKLDWMISARFTDGGKEVCGVVGLQWEVKAGCFDVDTGKELATSKQFTYVEINAARHAQRMVLTDYGRRLDFIDLGWTVGSLKKRTVWDFGTGKELVSWRPKSQSLALEFAPKPVQQPYAFDISPDGQSIVEGGAGMVSFYRIEP